MDALLSAPTNAFFIVDQTVFDLHRATILATIPQARTFLFPSGEKNKNLNTVCAVWDFLTDLQADRSCEGFIIGGGVTTDAGAFACATYKRGLKFHLIPTTLLAMVDATIGGKTGFNYHHIKNNIGLFVQPESIIVHRPFLDTLPERMLRSGWAEMLKHGLVHDSDHWQLLQRTDFHYVSEDMIYRSMKIKEAIVSEDPNEKGIRKILNFGHTIGHAIESMLLESVTEWLHGEAVALGMIAETALAVESGITSPTLLDEITTTVMKAGFPMQLPFWDEKAFIGYLLQDKKNTAGRVSMSVIADIGQPVLDFQPEIPAVLKVMERFS